MDSLTIEIEVSEALFSDHVKGLEALERKIGGQIDAILGIGCRVKLVEPKSIERSEGKAKRVIDKRIL
jgi:phenylacetate-CoA ligase